MVSDGLPSANNRGHYDGMGIVWRLFLFVKVLSINPQPEQPLSIRLVTVMGVFCAGNIMVWISRDLLFRDLTYSSLFSNVHCLIHDDSWLYLCPHLWAEVSHFPNLISGLVNY